MMHRFRQPFANRDWRLAIILLLTIGLLVPVLVLSGTFFPYVVPRNILFRVVVELALVVLVLALAFRGKRLDLRGEHILFALVAFLVAASLSALFSPARSHSFFGDFERMGGVWAWLHLVLFFLLLRTMRDEDWWWVLNAALAVSLIVSVNGILEHVQISGTDQAIRWRAAQSFSTVGNSGLLAGYLLFGTALAGYLALATPKYRWLYVACAGIDLTGLIVAQNRSTVIGFIAGSFATTLIFAVAHRTTRRGRSAPAFAIAFTGLVAALVALVRIFPGNPYVAGVPGVIRRLAGTSPAGSDASRTVQWEAAIEAFRDRPLLGYGPENHHLVWSAHFNPRIYGMDTDIFDRTHNQYLEILATTGLVGAVTFLAIWITIGYTLYRAYREARMTASTVALLAGLQVAYATYLVFWFVDLNATMLWILLAALIASHQRLGPVVRDATVGSERPALARAIAIACVPILGLSLYFHAYAPLRTSYALSRLDARGGDMADAFRALEIASASRAPQTSHTPIVMAQFLGSLGDKIDEMRADPADRRRLDRAFRASIAAFDAEIRRDRLNDRLYTQKAGLLMQSSRFYGSAAQIEEAIVALQRAIVLNPVRLQQRRLLASAYVAKGDSARARATLSEACRLFAAGRRR